ADATIALESCAGNNGDDFFEVETNEFLDPTIRVSTKGAFLPCIPSRRNEEAEYAKGSQLVHERDMAKMVRRFLTPDAKGLWTALPRHLACNRTDNSKMLLYKRVPASPQLRRWQRVYVFLINLMPKKLVI